MTIRIGLLGSGFVSNFYLQGLQGVADWEIPVVASPLARMLRALPRNGASPNLPPTSPTSSLERIST